MSSKPKAFEFNPGGLAGIDSGLRAGLQRYLATRENEINSQAHRTLRCVGGPFHSQTIDLAADADGTAEFRVGEFAGRYIVRTPRDPRSGTWAEWSPT
jgi:hypothetical protein